MKHNLWIDTLVWLFKTEVYKYILLWYSLGFLNIQHLFALAMMCITGYHLITSKPGIVLLPRSACKTFGDFTRLLFCFAFIEIMYN